MVVVRNVRVVGPVAPEVRLSAMFDEAMFRTVRNSIKCTMFAIVTFDSVLWATVGRPVMLARFPLSSWRVFVQATQLLIALLMTAATVVKLMALGTMARCSVLFIGGPAMTVMKTATVTTRTFSIMTTWLSSMFVSPDRNRLTVRTVDSVLLTPGLSLTTVPRFNLSFVTPLMPNISLLKTITIDSRQFVLGIVWPVALDVGWLARVATC